MNDEDKKERGFWKRFIRDPYILFMAGWVSFVLIISFGVMKSAWRYLGIFVVVVSIACDVIPIPTNPVIIGTVQLVNRYVKGEEVANFLIDTFSMPQGAFTYSVGKYLLPVAIGLVAAFGMVMANMMEYQIFSKLRRTKGIAKLRNARIYISWVKLFRKAPPLALMLTAFVPVPLDFIRIIAILEGYSRLKMSMYQFLGRLPRNMLLVIMGFAFPFWMVVPLAVILIIPALIYGWIDSYRERRGVDVEGERERVFKEVIEEIDGDEGDV